MAYEIAIRAVSVAGPDQAALARAASVVLTRLGNFPGLALLRHQFLNESDTARLPWQFSLEEEVRRDGNTVTGVSRTLTDFQTRLYYTLQRCQAASVSAPTSAGKSFVFAVDIAKKIQSATRPLAIVYVVPTRALIRQVTGDVRRHLKEAKIEGVPVRCVPLRVEKCDVPHGIIYVLTQERLLTLLHQDGNADSWVDMLLVDEAHGIKDGARGIQLHAAIDQVVRRFPTAQVYFASPCSRNPEHLLNLFSLGESGETFIEEMSPVGQNLILVHPDKVAVNVRFELVKDNDTLFLGSRELGFEFGSLTASARRAAFARAVAAGKRLGRCCCILYANNPNDAVQVASELAEAESALREVPEVIQDFVDFLSEHVHPQYALIPLLKKRVAFHHSKMPSPARAGVEDLFASGHLRHICCTATLLQGVNLPASDIIIECPLQGGEPMDRGSFLNLIGRAGRLGKEFHGNVWCLSPQKWKEPVFKGERLQMLHSAMEDVVADGGASIRRVLADQAMKEEAFDTGSAALGKVLQDFVLDGGLEQQPRYTLNADSEGWKETLQQVAPLGAILPAEILRRNFTVHPAKLSNLFQFFSSVEDLDSYVPIEPWKKGTYQRLKLVMQTARERLNPPVRPYYQGHAWLAFWWMQGKSLRWLLDQTIAYRQKRAERLDGASAPTVNEVIQQVLSDIENLLRFQYARDLKAYMDVLALVLRKRCPDGGVVELPQLPLYLECGSSNPGVIRLMSLGLSRMTALMVRRKITGMRNDASPEEWMAAIAVQRLDKFPLPKICIQEIKHLILGR